MAEQNFLSTMSQVTWGQEHPVEQSLSGATIADNEVSVLSGLTVNGYRGQSATVIPRTGGAVNGKVYHIISNTAVAITFEEDVQTEGLTASDSLVITQVNVIPSDLSNYFGHVEEMDLPVGKYSKVEVFPHGSTLKPSRGAYVRTGVVYESEVPLKLVNGKLLKLAMGKCIDDARNAGTYTDSTKTLLNETVRGQRTINSTAHGLTAGAYVAVGDIASSEEAEVRVIASAATDTITFTEPLYNDHDSGESLYTVLLGTGGYIIHTLSSSIRLPSWALKRTLFRHKGGQVADTDNCIIWTGIKSKSLKLEHSIGDELLNATMAMAALDEDDVTEDNRESLSDITDYDDTPYYRKNSKVVIDSIEYHKAGDFSGGIERELATKSYANSYRGIKPFEHIEGILTSDFSINVPYHNKNLYNLMKNVDKFDIAYTFYRDGDNTSNDELTLTFKDCYMEEAPESLPRDQGEIDISHTISPAYLEITVKDRILWY